MNLDLRTLQLFVAVVEEQTVAKAAKREHIAASAVSERIADLEKVSPSGSRRRPPATSTSRSAPSCPPSWIRGTARCAGQNPSTFFGIDDVVRGDTVSIAG